MTFRPPGDGRQNAKGRDRWGALLWRRDELECRWHSQYGLRFYARWVIERWYEFVPPIAVDRRVRANKYGNPEACWEDRCWRRLGVEPDTRCGGPGLSLRSFVFEASRDAGLHLWYPHGGETVSRWQVSRAEVDLIRVALDALAEGRTPEVAA